LFSVLASLQNVIKMLHLHLPSFVGDNACNSDSGITFLGFLGLCDNYWERSYVFFFSEEDNSPFNN